MKLGTHGTVVSWVKFLMWPEFLNQVPTMAHWKTSPSCAGLSDRTGYLGQEVKNFEFLELIFLTAMEKLPVSKGLPSINQDTRQVTQSGCQQARLLHYDQQPVEGKIRLRSVILATV